MIERMIGRLFFISVLIAVLSSCAKISQPSGGPVDKLPPVVVKCEPVNGVRNFKGKKLEIIFNEYVVLDNINDKFMVSPPMKKKPRVFIRGKGVNVEFDEKLKDSTTYTFYFLDAIRDLNAGNILQNYQFVFSTGPVIDSLSVTGNVYNSFNLETPEKTQVIMYREMADSAVVKHLPEYITRADPTGYFRIDNVRPGTYRLYGLKDGDNSKNYNLPDEDFAFMDSTVKVSSIKNYIPPPRIVKDTVAVKKVPVKSTTPGKESKTEKKPEVKIPEPVTLTGEFPLYMFSALKKAHYLTSSKRDLKYQLLYILSLPPDSMKFDFSIPGTESRAYFTEASRNRDTLKVWLTDSSLYSQPQISTILRYPFTDTLGVTGYKEDTILMRFLAPRAPRVAKVKRTPFTFESNLNAGSLKPGQRIYFKSKTPFRQPDTSRIKLYEVVLTNKQRIPIELVKDSINSCTYFMNSKLAEGKKYLFIADSASFGNIYNEYSDSLGKNFTVKERDTYCKLTLEIKNYTGAMIIQLLDKSEKLVAQNFMKKEGKIVFPLLEVGFYRVKVVYDLNGDGKWTTGDFNTHRQPEPVSYYPAEIEFKAGWELEFVGEKAWDVKIKNFKDPKLVEKKKLR
jgi:hypothetical protein